MICRSKRPGRNNAGGDHFSVKGEGFECEFLTLTTTCASGGSPGPLQDETPACTSTEGDGGGGGFSALPALTRLILTPTYGQEIATPDYTAEPADFVDDP